MKNLLLLFVLLLGCHDSEITLNEDDERFAALYADLLLLQVDYEHITGKGGTYAKTDSLQKIFSLHRLSSEVQDHALSLLSKRREQLASNPSNHQ